MFISYNEITLIKLLLLLFITFYGFFIYKAGTNHVSRVFHVTGVVWSKYMVHTCYVTSHNKRFFTFTLVLSEVRVQCRLCLFQ